MFNELEQKQVEGVTVENVGELIDELPVLDRYGAKDVSGLSQSVGRHAGLNPDGRPGLMECAIEPEARLVLEHEFSTACSDFF